MQTTTLGERPFLLNDAAKLYEIRDTVKRFMREDYLSKMQEWSKTIKDVTRLKGCDELEAVHALSKHCDDGMTKLFLLAAYVEMVEPS